MIERLKSLYSRCFVQLESSTFAAVWSLVLVLFYNLAFTRDLAAVAPIGEPMGLVFFVAMMLVLWLLTFFLLNLLVIPYLAKPLFSLLVFIAAAVAYFMGTYGVVIHKLMIQNVFETDPGEIQGLISASLIGYLLVLGLFPSILIWRARIGYARPASEIWRKVKGAGGALLLSIIIILCLPNGV